MTPSPMRVGGLDDGDLAAPLGQELRHLQAVQTGTDDHHLLAHGQPEVGRPTQEARTEQAQPRLDPLVQLGSGDHLALVALDRGRVQDAAGGQDDRVGLQRLDALGRRLSAQLDLDAGLLAAGA